MRYRTILIVTVMVGMAVFSGVIWKKVGELKKENQLLEREIGELRDRAKVKEPEPADKGNETLRQAEKLELMRLRNEVTQLRSSNSAVARIEQEKKQLEQENRNLRAERTKDPVEEFMHRRSREEWAFEGYSTPEKAYMSGMWALKEGQIEKMLEGMTPEEQERFRKNMEGKTEEEMAARFKKEWGWAKGLRVVEEQEVGPGEKILTVYVDGPQPVLKKVRMNQVGNEWKAGAPVNQNEDPMAMYRRNPELMKRYFPNFVPPNEGGKEEE